MQFPRAQMPWALLPLALLLAVPVQGAAPLADVHAPTATLEGALALDGGFAALRIGDVEDGVSTGTTSTSFRLDAQHLVVERDTATVAFTAGGAAVNGEPRTTVQPFEAAQVVSVRSLPGHAFTVLPDGETRVTLRSATVEARSAAAGTVAAKHFVDTDRPGLTAPVQGTVRIDEAGDGTITVRGDMLLVVWGWDVLLETRGSTRQYTTGYEEDRGVGVPGTVRVEQGTMTQLYLHARNATLVVWPEAGRDLGLHAAMPVVAGVRSAGMDAAAGVLGGGTKVAGESIELVGEGLEVRFGETRSGLLALQVAGDGAVRREDGTLVGPSAPVAPAPRVLWPWLVGVGAAFAAAAVAAWALRHRARKGPWRLRAAESALHRGHPRAARVLLQGHLRRDPDCVAGLQLAAAVEERCGRAGHELRLRLRADGVLVDGDRVSNARRILHLYAEIGDADEALAWFERCRAVDPGILRAVLAEPVFERLAQDAVVRSRAGRALGWEDPTGA